MFNLVCTSFNQPIGDWNVSNVTDMSFMFGDASSFNQPVENSLEKMGLADIFGHMFEPIQPLKLVKDQALDEIIKTYLVKLIQTTEGDFEKATKLSGLSKSHIYSLLKKYQISRK